MIVNVFFALFLSSDVFWFLLNLDLNGISLPGLFLSVLCFVVRSMNQ